MGTVKVKVTAEIYEFLAENQVELNYSQQQRRVPKGSEVYVSEGAVFEQFTRHANYRILPAGAFTHVVSSERGLFVA